jgi:hypothetical protein
VTIHQLTICQPDISPTWKFNNITIHQRDILPTWQFTNMTIRQHDNSPTWHFDNMTIRRITIRQHDILTTWQFPKLQFANMTFRQHGNSPNYNSPTWHLTHMPFDKVEVGVLDRWAQRCGSGIRCFIYPPDPGWIVFRIPDLGSRIFLTILRLRLSFWCHKKIGKSKFAFYFSCRIQDPGWKIVRIRIRDEKMFRSGSRIWKLKVQKMQKSAYRNMGLWVPKDAEFYVDLKKIT